MHVRSLPRVPLAILLVSVAALGAMPRGAAAQQIAARLADPSNRAVAAAKGGARPAEAMAGRRLAPIVTSSVSALQRFVRCPPESGACPHPFASIPLANAHHPAHAPHVPVSAYT